jgi:TetR/AcrR family transcriptional regulator, regulator of cefoperazone and chloramphenicol sensitivity
MSFSPAISATQIDTAAQARERLVQAALGLFAQKGFANTSTREIALAAGVNIAAISYYFGDKAGLYRAVFVEPLGSPQDDIPLYDQPHFTLRQSLDGFFNGFLQPMKQSQLVQQCMRLHFREMLEPTGLWMQEVETGIKPAHAALVAVLCRHLKLQTIDDEVTRLAFAISALALQMYMCRDVVDAIAPQLVDTPAAIDLAASRLADFATAMVAAEQARRATAATTKPVKTRKIT